MGFSDPDLFLPLFLLASIDWLHYRLSVTVLDLVEEVKQTNRPTHVDIYMETYTRGYMRQDICTRIHTRGYMRQDICTRIHTRGYMHHDIYTRIHTRGH